MTEQQAFEIVNKLQAIWDQREMSEETAAAYVDAVMALPFEAVGLALMELQKTETFRPSIALLYSTANEMLPGHTLPAADAAWGEVVTQIGRIGKTKRGMQDWAKPRNADGTWPTWEPEFSHPVIAEIVDALVWDELCMSENPMADRAHFLKMYDGAVQRHRRDQNLTPLEREYKEALGLIGKTLDEAPREVAKTR